MKFKKTARSKRAVYKYMDSFGRIIVIKEGDCTVDDHKAVTADIIRECHLMDDHWVESNIRNSKPARTKEEKAAIEAWNEAHPDDPFPEDWNQSFDQYFDDSDTDSDHSPIEHQVFNRTHEDNHLVELFYEVLEDMPEEWKFCLIRMKIQGYSREEVAKELGVFPSTVSHRIQKAIRFLKENEDRFNFR